MRLTDEQVMQDSKSFAHHNVLTELKYSGWNIPNRKSISNADIHFYAWLCRSAVAMLKEQEAVEPKEIVNEHFPVGDYRRTKGWYCGSCGEVLHGVYNYCSYCGKAVKWE